MYIEEYANKHIKFNGCRIVFNKDNKNIFKVYCHTLELFNVANEHYTENLTMKLIDSIEEIVSNNKYYLYLIDSINTIISSGKKVLEASIHSDIALEDRVVYLSTIKRENSLLSREYMTKALDFALKTLELKPINKLSVYFNQCKGFVAYNNKVYLVKLLTISDLIVKSELSNYDYVVYDMQTGNKLDFKSKEYDIIVSKYNLINS